MATQDGKMKCFHPQEFNGNVVSCGRCPACKQNRINGWVVRLEKHSRHQETAHFITLTYSEDNQAKRTKNGLLTLEYKHVQLFLKQVRNIQKAEYAKFSKEINQPVRGPQLSYYVAGEYGSRTSRPHYHLIMFNASLDIIHRAWGTNTSKGWIPRGNVHSGNITGGSIRYTLKYISKPSRIPLFKGDDRTPEFSYMSKGIGKSYLNKRTIAWHKADLLNRYYVPSPGGMKITMPRYYAERIYTKSERQIIAQNLEEISSNQFYKMVKKDQTIIRNLLESRRYIEKKAYLIKQFKL
jgi:hypothetical protein